MSEISLRIEQGCLSKPFKEQLCEQGYRFQNAALGQIAQRMSDGLLLLRVRGLIGERDKSRIQQRIVTFIVEEAGVKEIRASQPPKARAEGEI